MDSSTTELLRAFKMLMYMPSVSQIYLLIEHPRISITTTKAVQHCLVLGGLGGSFLHIPPDP